MPPESAVAVAAIEDAPPRVPPPEIAAFTAGQEIGRAAAARVFARLREGVTEKEVAADLRAELAREGVRAWLHHPFAWFGDRTCFRGFRTPLDFLPSDRRLRPGDAVILDVAPAHDGFPSDHALARVFGADPAWTRMKGACDALRRTILDALEVDRRADALFTSTNRAIEDAGYEVRHVAYPFQVLGHRLERFPLGERLAVGRPFSVSFLAMMGGQRLRGRRPLLNGSNRQSLEGVWAMEPHLGDGRIGVKFEELLWIHADGAQWLS